MSLPRDPGARRTADCTRSAHQCWSNTRAKLIGGAAATPTTPSKASPGRVRGRRYLFRTASTVFPKECKRAMKPTPGTTMPTPEASERSSAPWLPAPTSAVFRASNCATRDLQELRLYAYCSSSCAVEEARPCLSARYGAWIRHVPPYPQGTRDSAGSVRPVLLNALPGTSPAACPAAVVMVENSLLSAPEEACFTP